MVFGGKGEAMKKLIESISKLKELLGENGEYSISRHDKKLMSFTEAIMIEAILEDISIGLNHHLIHVEDEPAGQCNCMKWKDDGMIDSSKCKIHRKKR